MGLEPTTSSVTGWRSNQLNYRAMVKTLFSLKGLRNAFAFRWQGKKVSHPRHAVLETAALPTELFPYVGFIAVKQHCYGSITQEYLFVKPFFHFFYFLQIMQNKPQALCLRFKASFNYSAASSFSGASRTDLIAFSASIL